MDRAVHLGRFRKLFVEMIESLNVGTIDTIGNGSDFYLGHILIMMDSAILQVISIFCNGSFLGV